MVVIGVGNEFRRDDGAGPAVVGQLRDRVPPGVELVITDGEPARLIEAWTGAALAVVVDAVRAQPPQPGTVYRFVVDRPGTGTERTASSHGLGLDDAISLAVAQEALGARTKAMATYQDCLKRFPDDPLALKAKEHLRILQGDP